MTPAELQSAILAHLSEQGLTPQQIKDMKSENSPYPVNGKYIWYLTKGIVKGRHTQLVMADFFNKLNEEKCKTTSTTAPKTT
jgi:hypothetical protein